MSYHFLMGAINKNTDTYEYPRIANKKYKKYNKYESDEDGYFRCGRNGHYASSCYASKHINGYYIK